MLLQRGDYQSVTQAFLLYLRKWKNRTILPIVFILKLNDCIISVAR